jgi:hypothetical protein
VRWNVKGRENDMENEIKLREEEKIRGGNRI